MRKNRLIIFLLFFFILHSNCSAYTDTDEELRFKIKGRLQILRQILLENQKILHDLNKKLIIENQQFFEENIRLKQVLEKYGEQGILTGPIKPGGKIVYESDLQQQQEIMELLEEHTVVKDRFLEQRDELQNKLKAGDKRLTSLQKQVATSSQQKEQLRKELAQGSEELIRQNTQLNQTLEKAQEQQAKLIQEFNLLEEELKAQPGEKIVYKPDPEQLKGIAQLRKELTQGSEELISQNTQLTQTLEKAQEEQAKLIQEINLLEKELESKPGGKIVYESDLQQQEITELLEEHTVAKERFLEQRDELQNKLKAGDKLIASLQEQVATSSQQKEQLRKRLAQGSEGLIRQDTQLNQTLEKAQEEQARLIQEINRLEEELKAQPGEKIVYKPNPEQLKEIAQLRKRLARGREDVIRQDTQLNQTLVKAHEEQTNLLQEISRLEEELKAKSGGKIVYKPNPEQLKEIAQLRKRLTHGSEDFIRQNAQLNQSLVEAQKEQSRLIKKINRLKNELKDKRKEKIIYESDPQQAKQIRALKKRINELNRLLQVQTRQVAKEEQRIRKQLETINSIDGWIKDVLW